MGSTTEDDFNFIWKIFVFYIVYVIFLNTFAFMTGTPSLFDLNPTDDSTVNLVANFFGSFGLGNWSGIPSWLSVLVGGLTFIIAVMVPGLFIYNKVRGL